MPGYDVLDVCRYVANYHHWQGYPLTNLRLQKILYFLQIAFYGIYNRPCFEGEIEAWDLGPVVRKAYRYYQKDYPQLIPGTWDYREGSITTMDKRVMALVIEILSQYSTDQLIYISQKQKPWKKNYVSYDTHVIPQSDVKEFALHAIHSILGEQD